MSSTRQRRCRFLYAVTVPREPGGEGAIVLRDPDGAVHVEPRVRPGEHAGGLALVEQLQAHEEPEHGAPERLGQPGGVMHWPRDERPIRPKAAVGFVYRGEGGDELFDLNSLAPDDILAIEVYKGGATMPLEYNATRKTCGLLVIFTK